jgi:pentatricopeptide repeat protein
VPLIEAFVHAGQVPQAIQVLATMRSAGLTPTLRTAEPIASALASAELIDQAFYAIEDLPAGTVDVAALNALILASARLGDLQRVRATQTAASALGIEPDIDTFNLTFAGCITAGHRPLGDTLLDEMAKAGIQPNATTYERMILLCLIPVKYDDAFYYLEKMKVDGFPPPYSVYRAILRKCIDAGDRRWRMVVEEVQSLGLRLDKEMQSVLEDASRGGRGRTAEGWSREEARPRN